MLVSQFRPVKPATTQTLWHWVKQVVIWRFKSSGMRQCVAVSTVPDIRNEHSSFTTEVNQSNFNCKYSFMREVLIQKYFTVQQHCCQNMQKPKNHSNDQISKQSAMFTNTLCDGFYHFFKELKPWQLVFKMYLSEQTAVTFHHQQSLWNKRARRSIQMLRCYTKPSDFLTNVVWYLNFWMLYVTSLFHKDDQQ